MGSPAEVEPFVVKDCTLAAISTGRRAQSLRELRDGLLAVAPESIYYHFWGILLRPHFDDPEYNNDFASWVRHELHDDTLAERLAVIDPADYSDLESLRQELLEIIEARLDETEFGGWTSRYRQFHFVRAQTVVFDTGRRLQHPRELAEAVATLSLGSIYYHVIDARRREPLGIDDFRVWLGRFGDPFKELHDRLADIDPYFTTLGALRATLASTLRSHPFDGRRP
jgi:hypothetical protein